MFITITGDLGSGKTTIAKMIAKELGYQFLSVGDFMGEIAMEKGMSLLELSKEAEKSDEIDKILDAKQVEFGKTHDNIVFDSRLGWHFIPHSTKIYFQVSIDEGAKRVFDDKREDEKENTTLDATKENMIVRKESEKKRYLEYYGVTYDNPENYDFVLDTSNLTIEEVYEKTSSFIKKEMGKPQNP